MAPLAFYDALAASASVFIGILTALLISNLSTRKTARERIARRITAINARVESLASRRDRLRENLDRIEEVWDNRAQQDAKEDIEDFIDRYVGSDFIAPIENINQRVLLQELADYLDWEVEELNQYHKEELQSRLAEIEAKLVDAIVKAISSDYDEWSRGELDDLEWEEFRDNFKSQHGVTNLDEKTRKKLESEYNRITPDPAPDSLFGQISRGALSASAGNPLLNDLSPMPISSEAHAARMQSENQQRIHEENQYHRDKNQHVRTETEIDALETEREQLVTRFESLDPSQLRSAVRTSVGTILASVLFPLLIHLLHILGWVWRVPESWTVWEPIVVFLVWIAGLGWVFWHIRNEVTEETVDVPEDSPEV